MKINDTIKRALKAAAWAYGSQTKLSRVMGIKPSTLSRYLNGRVKNINTSTWNMIYPLLKEYLLDNQAEPSKPNKYLPDNLQGQITGEAGAEHAFSDEQREALEREVKLAKLRLNAFYLQRKIQRLTNAKRFSQMSSKCDMPHRASARGQITAESGKN